MPSDNRDSEGIRASVLDVCVQLGALENNSLVARWMFGDESEGSLGDQANHVTFQETPKNEDDRAATPEAQTSTRRFLFLAKPFTLAARFRSRNHTAQRDITSDGTSSSQNRLFYRRGRHKSDPVKPADKPERAIDSDQGSTNSRKFFGSRSQGNRRLPAEGSADATEFGVIDPPADDEDEWVEVEVRPDSPFFPLKNRGINPQAVMYSRDSTASSKGKDLKDPSVRNSAFKLSIPRAIRYSSFSTRRQAIPRPLSLSLARPSSNSHRVLRRRSRQDSRSQSAPSSPFVLVTTHDRKQSPNTPGPTPPPKPALSPSTTPTQIKTTAAEKEGSQDMGYHHQFFVQQQSESTPASNSGSHSSLPEDLVEKSKQRGRKIPFPTMPVYPVPYSMRPLINEAVSD